MTIQRTSLGSPSIQPRLKSTEDCRPVPSSRSTSARLGAIEQLNRTTVRDAHGGRLLYMHEACQVLLERKNVYALLDRELDTHDASEASAAAVTSA